MHCVGLSPRGSLKTRICSGLVSHRAFKWEVFQVGPKYFVQDWTREPTRGALKTRSFSGLDSWIVHAWEVFDLWIVHAWEVFNSWIVHALEVFDSWIFQAKPLVCKN